jgi:hypothetical protein
MGISRLRQTVSHLHDYLAFLEQTYGERALASKVARAVERLRLLRGFDDQDAFLDHYGIRGQYRKAISIRRGRILDRLRLAQCLRRMDMPADLICSFESRFAPWDAWQEGACVAIVVGRRHVTTRQSSSFSMRTDLVGTHDHKALGHLERILAEEARIKYHPRPRQVAGYLDRDAAEAFLDDLCRKMRGGAIIVMGSPLRNPIADPIARRIMDLRGHELPARFRWHFRFQGSDGYLVEPEICQPREAGVRQRGHGRTTYRRVTDEQIMKEAASRGTLAPSERLGPYADAGILAMDCQHDPMLILCAGHGGCGTLAAVLGLSETMYVERCLLNAQEELGLEPGRLFQPVTVDRYKPTLDAIDDLEFNEEYGVGWHFPWA